MSRPVSLEALWREAAPGGEPFDPSSVDALPEPARRYLHHAFAPGARIPSAVRLILKGTIRLKGWCPFTAEQVILRDRGMIWAARVRMMGLPIRGWDRILDGAGAMRWALFGLLPFLRADGRDITRSAEGRLRAESLWLPSAFLDARTRWTPLDHHQVRATLPPLDGPTGDGGDVALSLGPCGAVHALTLPRWGNPGGGPFSEAPFGGLVLDEGTFHGVTIPTELRVGWWPGTPRFETEGEFFRCRITAVAFSPD